MLIAILTIWFIPAFVWTVCGARDLVQASAHPESSHYDPNWKIEVVIWTILSLLVSVTLLILATLLHLNLFSEVEMLNPMLYELVAMTLLQVLNREFKRAISVGHKPFVNPWCDDTAVECRRPEF
jgi:hypothetical protein